MRILLAGLASAGLLAVAPTEAPAASLFTADLTPLNGSGVSGTAHLKLDEKAHRLNVKIEASGLVPDMLHVQHIHGRSDPSGKPIDSLSPPPSADTDRDGFVELAEGAKFYGPIIVPLSRRDGSFPTAPGGTIEFESSYDLTDSSVFNEGFGKKDLLPLALREIVLHGGFVPPGVEDIPGDVTGQQYSAFIPVASGEIAAVPLPAAAWMLLGGLAALFGLRRKLNA